MCVEIILGETEVRVCSIGLVLVPIIMMNLQVRCVKETGSPQTGADTSRAALVFFQRAGYYEERGMMVKPLADGHANAT